MAQAAIVQDLRLALLVRLCRWEKMSVPAGVFVRARTESAVKRIATDATKLLMIVFTLAFLFFCFGYPKFFCDSRVEAVPGSASTTRIEASSSRLR